jgi:hypothetical protein
LRIKGHASIALDRSVDGRRAKIQTERVQQRHVVFDSRSAIGARDRYSNAVPQLGDESSCVGHFVGNVPIYCLPDLTVFEESDVIGADIRNLVEFWQRRNLGEAVDIESERDPTRKSAEDDISKLDAVGWNSGAQTDVVLHQELREIFENHKEYTQSAFEEDP